jgi:hypothetical protein
MWWPAPTHLGGCCLVHRHLQLPRQRATALGLQQRREAAVLEGCLQVVAAANVLAIGIHLRGACGDKAASLLYERRASREQRRRGESLFSGDGA